MGSGFFYFPPLRNVRKWAMWKPPRNFYKMTEPTEPVNVEAIVAPYKSQIETLQKQVDQLLTDNKKARDAKRAAETEANELRDKQPPEGAVILSANDATKWQSWKELSLDPEAIKTAVDENTRYKRQDSIAKAAAPHSYKPHVLAEIVPVDASFAVEAVKDAEGNDAQAAFITIGDTKTQLDTWLKENKADFMPALAVDTQQVTPSRQWVQQPSNSSAPPTGDPVADFIKQRESRRSAHNALNPAPVTNGV